MKAYRAGYNTMWRYARAYMKRKGFKEPGEFRKDNQHGGRLWACRKECQMTNTAAGEIIERVYESEKVSKRQLAQVLLELWRRRKTGFAALTEIMYTP